VKKKYDIVYLWANPLVREFNNTLHPITHLNVTDEKKCFRIALEESQKKLKYKIDSATSDSLSHIALTGCKVLHFTGHGAKGGLYFEAENGLAHFIAPKFLKDLIMGGKDECKIQLVFVAACNSINVGKAFVNAGIPHVVASTEEIEDTCTKKFMQHFYLALLSSRTVSEAFKHAVNLVRAMPDPADHVKSTDEAAKFILLPPRGDHDKRIFQQTSEGNLTDMSPKLNGRINQTHRELTSRGSYQYKLMNVLNRRNNNNYKVVNIHGPKGIGKTVLAENIASYFYERSSFTVVNLPNALFLFVSGR